MSLVLRVFLASLVLRVCLRVYHTFERGFESVSLVLRVCFERMSHSQ
jgi:hypothetical protein